MELEILAELEPAIGVRQGHGALDEVGHRLAGGVREVVEGQQDDVVAHADAAVLAAPAHEGGPPDIRGGAARAQRAGGELVGGSADEGGGGLGGVHDGLSRHQGLSWHRDLTSASS